MSDLEISLEKLAATNARIQDELNRSDGRPNDSALASLRSSFTTEMAAMHAHLNADARLAANPALAAQFDERWYLVRQRFFAHQARWRISEIASDPAAYRASASEVDDALVSFTRWATSSIARA